MSIDDAAAQRDAVGDDPFAELPDVLRIWLNKPADNLDVTVQDRHVTFDVKQCTRYLWYEHDELFAEMFLSLMATATSAT